MSPGRVSPTRTLATCEASTVTHTAELKDYKLGITNTKLAIFNLAVNQQCAFN